MVSRSARCFFFFSLLLTLLIVLVGCATGSQANSRTPTVTAPAKTGTAGPGSTPLATATPATACDGQFSDVLLPANAMQVGKTTTKGATTDCSYRVALDLQTTANFFKNQMGAATWTLIKEEPQGPGSVGQEYFKAQSFVTIILTQHGSDTQTTDIHITVEVSQ